MIASSTLDMGSDGVDTKQLIETALVTVAEATLGEIQTEFLVTSDADPMPGLNEATGTDHPSPPDTGCAFERGCVHIGFTAPGSGVMISSRATLKESVQPADAFVHDIIGHGIMGMCHIDQALIGGKRQVADGRGTRCVHGPPTRPAQRPRHRRRPDRLRLIAEPRRIPGRLCGGRLDRPLESSGCHTGGPCQLRTPGQRL